MEPSVWIWNLGQFIGYILLLRYLQVQVRDLKLSLESHMKDSYSKTDVDKLIDLKQQPLEVKLTHIQTDITEIKAMLQKLFDANH
jgi:hypothetical protein